MKVSAGIFLGLFWLSSAAGQLAPSQFQKITAKEGLSQGHVLCMIQDADGYIWAESEPGKGTTFRFTIPLQL